MGLGDGMGQRGAWTQMTWIQCLAMPHPNLMVLEKKIPELNSQEQGHEDEQRQHAISWQQNKGTSFQQRRKLFL